MPIGVAPGVTHAVPSPLQSCNQEEADWFNQLLFSYKLNPQTALYVGYSDLLVDSFFDNGTLIRSDHWRPFRGRCS